MIFWPQGGKKMIFWQQTRPYWQQINGRAEGEGEWRFQIRRVQNKYLLYERSTARGRFERLGDAKWAAEKYAEVKR
jgi:hypothetical protein